MWQYSTQFIQAKALGWRLTNFGSRNNRRLQLVSINPIYICLAPSLPLQHN